MKKQQLEVVHGSGNVFRDLGLPDADVLQLKAILAAEILKTLERDKLTVRKAQELTGVDAGDFARIRQANLERFTVDRLMMIVFRLGSRVDVKVKVRPMRRPRQRAG